HAGEREGLESKWREQLNGAKAAAEKAETACKQEAQRSRAVEAELAGLRQVRDELNGKLAAAQQAAAESRRRGEELESGLRAKTEELKRAATELERQAAERARHESQCQKLSETNAVLGAELSRLVENRASQEDALSAMERRVREGVASLARVTADLEIERGERRRIEQRASTFGAQLQELHKELKQHLQVERVNQNRIADLERQLREREEALASASADLEKEAADRHLAEEQLGAVGDMTAQLRQCLAQFEEAKKAFSKTQEDLESQLQANSNSSSEREARLQKEVLERQRLEEAWQAAQRKLQEQSQNSAIELSRLQSALQLELMERQRLEGEAMHSHFASLDAARSSRALVNGFCRQVRQPVNQLIQSMRRLLELELRDEQAALVQVALENSLLLQTCLQQSGALNYHSFAAEVEGGDELSKMISAQPSDRPQPFPSSRVSERLPKEISE
ncbi:MAG TPA: hypothetical protein VEL06_17250, partial [Haliangiales bacterium]|nr:hypothetical protein [Haliangiales bacterium]